MNLASFHKYRLSSLNNLQPRFHICRHDEPRFDDRHLVSVDDDSRTGLRFGFRCQDGRDCIRCMNLV